MTSEGLKEMFEGDFDKFILVTKFIVLMKSLAVISSNKHVLVFYCHLLHHPNYNRVEYFPHKKEETEENIFPIQSASLILINSTK